MTGYVYKRCPCGTIKDGNGRRINCRKKHGSWTYVHELPSTSGRSFTPQAGAALLTGGPPPAAAGAVLAAFLGPATASAGATRMVAISAKRMRSESYPASCPTSSQTAYQPATPT